MRVEVDNDFDLPVGARIIVAHAQAGFSRKVHDVVVGGGAWAAEGEGKIGNQLANRIGKSSLIHIDCEGTNGKTKSSNITELGVGSILSLGTGVTTAFGGKKPSGTVAKTTATVEDVMLLKGAVRADAVTAVAQERIYNGSKFRSTQGSSLVGVRVLGVLQPVNVPPNTVVPLPFGRVILNQQIIPPAGSNAPTEVKGIVVIITQANALNLPIGSRIVVAHAHARAHLFDEEPAGTTQQELNMAETTN